MAHLVGHGFKKRVLLPDRRLETVYAFWNGAVVSADEVEALSILRFDDVVSRVLVSHAEFFKEFALIVAVVPVGVLTSVKPGHGDHVKAVEGVKKAEGSTDFSLSPIDGLIGESFQRLDLDWSFFGWKRDPKNALVVLIGNNEATFGIERHRDPRALLPGDLIKEFGVKAVTQCDSGVGVLDEPGIVLSWAGAQKK
jgi:hypothetical protein